MGGHEGNTQSITKRCIFFVSLVTTLYWILILSDIWPREPEAVLLSLQKIQGKSDASAVDVNSLNSLLAKLDYYYTHEINADHHDDDHHPQTGHDDSHEDHADHESAKVAEDKIKQPNSPPPSGQVPPATPVTAKPTAEQGPRAIGDDLDGLRKPFTEPGLKIQIPPTVATVVSTPSPVKKEQPQQKQPRIIELDDWQDDLDLDGLLQMDEF